MDSLSIPKKTGRSHCLPWWRAHQMWPRLKNSPHTYAHEGLESIFLFEFIELQWVQTDFLRLSDNNISIYSYLWLWNKRGISWATAKSERQLRIKRIREEKESRIDRMSFRLREINLYCWYRYYIHLPTKGLLDFVDGWRHLSIAQANLALHSVCTAILFIVLKRMVAFWKKVVSGFRFGC